MIKDIDLFLRTLDKNIVIFDTNHINGVLDSIIFKTNKLCQLDIVFKEDENISIFSNEIVSSKYCSIRNQTLTPDGQLLLSGFAKIKLNNKLTIIIKGQKQTSVSLTLRGEFNG